MSLGNFTLGSTVRMPLHLTYDGGLPITNAENIKVYKIIRPNGSSDPNYPSNMTLADPDISLYYLDYKPQSVGNYIVIYSFSIGGATYSAMDSFYISPAAKVSGSGGYARPVQFLVQH
jgi:hypothetical protein